VLFINIRRTRFNARTQHRSTILDGADKWPACLASQTEMYAELRAVTEDEAAARAAQVDVLWRRDVDAFKAKQTQVAQSNGSGNDDTAGD